MCHIHPRYILLLRLHLSQSNRKIIHGDIAFQRIGGYRKCCHECSLCVYLVIDNFFVCTFWCFTPVSNFKAIGQLVMEILHFKDLGVTASIVTNAVVLVLREIYDFIECFTTTFLHTHSWLNWVDEDDDEDEVWLEKKSQKTLDTSKRLHWNKPRSTRSVDKGVN